MDAAISEVPRLVRDLYKVVSEMERLFAEKNKKFTPDGHLVGSLGEVLAAHLYELELYPNSHPGHDAVSSDGLEVQIKATQGRSRVALRSEPKHLIVLRIERNGQPKEIYNGPGSLVWKACTNGKKRPSTGQYSVALSTLKKLMDAEVPQALRLPQLRHITDAVDTTSHAPSDPTSPSRTAP
jgi:hypothetical protein